MSKWLWQLKWALAIAIIAGPALAYYSYNKGNVIRDVLAHGVAARGAVVRVDTQTHRRGGTTYTMRTGWLDAAEAPHAGDIPISEAMAQRVVVNNELIIDHTTIKYLPADPEGSVVVVDDAQEQLSEQQSQMWFGIVAGILGLILAPLMFWWERREEKRREAEIDAALAESRARTANG